MRNPVLYSSVLPARVMTRAARAVYSLLVAAALIAPTHVLAAAASPEPASVPVSLETDDVEMDVLDEIVVYGTDGKVVEGLYAEAELGEADVAAYGADTVGDLIAQVAPDVDNTEEGPVILINGKPANGIRSVNDLPSEAVASIQVLPPQAAAALGYSPTRRVINVVMKNTFRQASANGTVRGATAGRGLSSNANVSMVRVNANRYQNFGVRVSKTEPLLEAHRGIVSEPAGLPYDLVGNVLSWPLAGGDIDPALSALTGYPVTVAGLPVGVSSPSLEDFASQANSRNVSELGRYRTLLSDQYSLGLSGGLAFQPRSNMTLNLSASMERSQSVSRTGAPTALLHVPASSPFSPFSQDVSVARYLGAPLRQETDPTVVNLSANLYTQMGRWQVMIDASHLYRGSSSVIDRRVDVEQLQASIDAGLLNPFAPLPEELLGDVLIDRARSRGHTSSLQMQASGALFRLPAGQATLSLRTELRQNRQRSRTTGTTVVESNRNRRDEVAFASLQIPLLGKNTPTGFGLAAEVSGSARGVTAAGTLFDYGYGMNWRLGNRITMRVAINHQEVAPQPEMLTNPIVTVDDFRTYDFIRQETVLVRYITGGNPDLDVERRRGTRIGFTLRPFAQVDLMMNAEYQRTVGRDAASALPAVSEDVQAAFPDRYRRDAEGRLYEIDARLVSFARSNTEQLRWGGSFRRTFGVPQGPPGAMGQPQMVMFDGNSGEDLAGAGWRITANLTHTWQLANKRLAREGLPEQDLLAGGAGTGSGQSRHALQSRIGAAYNGTGLQLNVNWKGRTHITAGTTDAPNDIVFSPLLRLDVSAFANLGTVFPGNTLVEGTRVTLALENLLDAKQRVRDETGATPLRYQAYLISALGRTVSLSLRKAF